jgi:hypothetical protein
MMSLWSILKVLFYQFMVAGMFFDNDWEYNAKLISLGWMNGHRNDAEEQAK